MTTWILVSDSSRATLFTAELREDRWRVVQTFSHEAGREPSREIEASSPPGRMHQGQTAGGHHTALEPRTWPKEAEAQRFATSLGNYLEDALARRQFDQIVLVAPPHFLGILKDALGKQTAKQLRAAVNKELATLDASQIRERLLDLVFPPAGEPA